MRLIKNPWIGKEGYNCFGCCPTNPIGLQMRFYEDGEDIVSIWHPNLRYQSWINTIHGLLPAEDIGGDSQDGVALSSADVGVHAFH